MKAARALCAGLTASALLLPAPALSQAYQCRLPERIQMPRPERPDGPVRRVPVARYTLAASWSPEFCKYNAAGSPMQCSGQNGRFGFILHGLWPEARSGPPPQWCAASPRPSPALLRRNLCMTPSVRLLEHEWAKHGSCMARRPETYFKVSAILWNAIAWPDADRLSRKRDLTAGDLRREFILANPDWKPSQIGIRTNGKGWLKEVQLCFGRNFRPQDCPVRTLGARDSAPLKIWRGM